MWTLGFDLQITRLYASEGTSAPQGTETNYKSFNDSCMYLHDNKVHIMFRYFPWKVLCTHMVSVFYEVPCVNVWKFIYRQQADVYLQDTPLLYMVPTGTQYDLQQMCNLLSSTLVPPNSTSRYLMFHLAPGQSPNVRLLINHIRSLTTHSHINDLRLFNNHMHHSSIISITGLWSLISHTYNWPQSLINHMHKWPLFTHQSHSWLTSSHSLITHETDLWSFINHIHNSPSVTILLSLSTYE